VQCNLQVVKSLGVGVIRADGRVLRGRWSKRVVSAAEFPFFSGQTMFPYGQGGTKRLFSRILTQCRQLSRLLCCVADRYGGMV
jgi:hypothetical protein